MDTTITDLAKAYIAMVEAANEKKPKAETEVEVEDEKNTPVDTDDDEPDEKVEPKADPAADDDEDEDEEDKVESADKDSKNDGAAYKKFFASALKKFGVKSQGELSGEKEKEFYDYVDDNWKADDEKSEKKESKFLDLLSNSNK
jgi:peptide subunit release factor RF-3